MTHQEFDREQLEHACVVLSKVLRELVQEKKIDALEFLSIVGHLPIKLSEIDARRWRI
jgi:hypothetical protein